MTRFLVLGAGRSGLGAVAALARVRPTTQIRLVAPAAPEGVELPGVELVVGREDASLLDEIDVLVKSPGVPETAPLVLAARDREIPVWGEIELAYRLIDGSNPIVGVTGTNGKTTTTLLLAAMLSEGGVPAVAAGNIGTALTSLAGEIEPGRVIVCELSSFQLENVETLRCDVAVLLNLTPDHLDRHGSLAQYGEAKLRIFERQRATDTAVLCIDDPWVDALETLPGEAQIERVSGAVLPARLEDAFARSRLRGPHNRSNAACATRAALALGADRAGICRALESFAPPPHRLEEVRVLDGVRYVNDSKATNVEATVQALAAFERGVHVILGGSLKGGDFAALRPAVERHATRVYLIGEAAARLAATLEGAATPVSRDGTLERALKHARREAQPGETVLLAPACASFDQFQDFEQRGDRFRELVEGLA